MVKRAPIRPQFIILCSAIALGAIKSFLILLPYTDAYVGDWPIFWYAGQAPDDLYDFQFSKFAYPPPMVVLLRPFAALPMWAGLAAWSLVGLMAIYFSARLIAPARAICVALAMPACILCLLAGQTGLLIGALAILAVAKRSGIFFGLGVVLKPHSFAALPFTDWRPRLAATAIAAAFVAAVVASMMFGVVLWSDWADSIDDFRTAVSVSRIVRLDVGMTGLAYVLGLPAWIYFFGAALGVACTTIVFRATDQALDRYAAFVCGAVLISPYTLGYDLAGLSIAAMAMLLDPRRGVACWIAAALIVTGIFANLGVLALASLLIVQHYGAFRWSIPSNPPRPEPR